eukprot:gene8622-6054_t
MQDCYRESGRVKVFSFHKAALALVRTANILLPFTADVSTIFMNHG